MRKWLALALLLSVCGCKTSSSGQRSASLTESVQSATQTERSETRTVTQGPETVVTTIEEFAMPAVAAPADGRTGACCISQIASDGGAAHEALTHVAAGIADSRVAAQPLLTRRTTTVDVRGPITASTSLQAAGATETHAAAEVTQRVATKRTFAPASLLALWPYLLAGVVAGGLWLAIRRGVRWPPW